MLLRNKTVNEDCQNITDYKSELSIKEFALLLLADLASKSKIKYFSNENIKIACLNIDYKKIIEYILYQESNWKIEFSKLIDMYYYLNFQGEWERDLGRTIGKILKELNKELNYDLENDVIKIEFTKDEIDNIKGEYDCEILKIMDHFSDLVNDSIFTRKYQLEQKKYVKSKIRE